MIEKLDTYSLQILVDTCNHILAHMTEEEQSEWEGTPFGVEMMHARIRLLGLRFIATSAPYNWAWQLLGELGCGYRGFDQSRIRGLIIKKNWHNLDAVGARG